MCFFLKTNSEKEKCDILFLNESIWFENNGRNRVLYDIIIKNTCSQSIESFLIIYPRPFFIPNKNIKKKKTDGLEKEVKQLDFLGFFEDRSSEWLNPNLTWNKFLRNSAFHDLSKGNAPDTMNIKIRDNNLPWDQEKGYSIEGSVYNNKYALKPHPDITAGMVISSFDFGFSILQYDCKEKPINPNEIRLLRWYFSPINSTINCPNMAHRFILNVINELYYNYIIAGPTQVFNWIYERLNIELVSIDSSIHSTEGEKLNRKSIENLLGIITSTTGEINLGYQRLILFPRKLRALFNFVYSGSIEPLGGLQNFTSVNIEPPTIRSSCKENKKHSKSLWRKRAYYFANKTEDNPWERNKFLLYFTAKNHVRLFKLMPYVTLIIVFDYSGVFHAISLVINNISLFSNNIDVLKGIFPTTFLFITKYFTIKYIGYFIASLYTTIVVVNNLIRLPDSLKKCYEYIKDLKFFNQKK